MDEKQLTQDALVQQLKAGPGLLGPYSGTFQKGTYSGPDLQGQGWTPAVSRRAEYLKGSSAHCSDITKTHSIQA